MYRDQVIVKLKIWADQLLARSWISNQKPPNEHKSRPYDFTSEFYQKSKEELLIMLILLKLSSQIEEGGTLPNTFYEAGSTNFQSQTSMPQKKKIIGQYSWWT